MASSIKCILVVVAIIVALAIAGLLGFSLRTVSDTDVALKYDKVTYKLGKEALSSGLYVGPPGFKLVNFPVVYRTIKYDSLSCLNKDGLYLDVSYSFQYRVKLNKLYQVVLSFRDHDKYLEVLESVGEAAMLETCGSFNTSHVIQNRPLFASTFKDNLSEFSEEYMAEILGVQVDNIDRPDKYNDILQSTDATKEKIQVRISERLTKETEARTELEQARRQAVVTLGKAEVEARKIITQAEAEAEGIREQLRQEAEVYKLLVDAGYSGQQFVSYMGVEAMAGVSKPLQVGIKSPRQN